MKKPMKSFHVKLPYDLKNYLQEEINKNPMLSESQVLTRIIRDMKDGKLDMEELKKVSF